MIHYTEDGPVATVTMSNPDRLNALTASDMGDLLDAWSRVQANDDIRVAILTGDGDAFCSGRDIYELAEIVKTASPGAFWKRPGKGYGGALSDGLAMWKPVIAAVNGYCNGEGMAQAVGCDIRIASRNATFRLIEAEVGINTVTAATLMTKLIGHGPTALMAFGCDPIDADEALRIGLVDRVVEPDALHDEVMALAMRIASNAPLAIRAIKEVMVRSQSTPFESTIAIGESLRNAVRQSSDFAEGLNAFIEKRPPRFEGR